MDDPLVHRHSSPRFAFLVSSLAWLTAVPTATPQPYIDWATEHFTAAERAAGRAAPRQDPDRDGWPNLLEYSLGTHPQDSHSLPRPAIPGDGDPAACCPLPTGDHATGLQLQLSSDLEHWHPAPVVSAVDGILTAPLGEMCFVRFEAFALPGHPIDSDSDGLHDLFEEQLANASANDSLNDIGDVNPLDDNDGNGIPNIDEADNFRPSGCGFPTPPLLDPASVAAAADMLSPPAAPILSIHTPLR